MVSEGVNNNAYSRLEQTLLYIVTKIVLTRQKKSILSMVLEWEQVSRSLGVIGVCVRQPSHNSNIK